ncbi:MAG: SMP-30/gluconolactonase/LRE family protein [Haliscomenobacteraceae bacterium CHB4]|nr:SMP-30/gluconolactonase/LRE family protein [Haliscomenobacteraceae bacterium CHB4]
MLVGLTFLFSSKTNAQEHRELAIGQADVIVDLRTREGASAVNAVWKFHEANIVETDFKAPGASGADPLPLYPTGKKIKSHRLEPKAGAAGFDDSGWATLDPTRMETRFGSGLLSFVWFRLNVTIPEKIGDYSSAGSTAVLEIVADDYSEIFVNGILAKTFGQSGSGAVSGWNARNRVFLTDNAQAGQQSQIAILVANAPFADLPENYVWFRSATIDFYKKYPQSADWQDVGKLVQIEKSFGDVIAPDAKVEKLADGFQFTEGPVWHPDGFLLFSDPNANVIYRYEPQSRNVSIYMSKSGYTGFDIGAYHQPGSNGLAIDTEGRLIVCQHGNRRVVRHEKKGPVTVLADNWEGRKLNSPNDLVLKSGGAVYFTDPPYGLPKNYADAHKEMPHQGVYRIKNGKTELLTTDLGGPNGIAFSPDEKYLYVANWDIRDIHHTKTLWRYEVTADGLLANGKIFFDFSFTDGDEALDGVKVDNAGNLFVSAPGGVWILSPEGKYLGKITGPERPANMAWGDADGKTLYLTAHTGLYKIRTLNGGKTAGQNLR